MCDRHDPSPLVPDLWFGCWAACCDGFAFGDSAWHFGVNFGCCVLSKSRACCGAFRKHHQSHNRWWIGSGCASLENKGTPLWKHALSVVRSCHCASSKHCFASSVAANSLDAKLRRRWLLNMLWNHWQAAPPAHLSKFNMVIFRTTDSDRIYSLMYHLVKSNTVLAGKPVFLHRIFTGPMLPEGTSQYIPT